MITDFLDLELNLNLNDISYIPYKLKFKYYVHQQKFKSFKNIIKQIQNTLNDRLNKISSMEENFLN